MKITRIEKFPLNLKIVKTGYRRKDDLNAMVSTIIIRVNTDKDTSGLGEAATTRSYFNQTIGTMQDWLVAYEQVLIGEDPRDIIKIHHKMDLVSGERAPGCHPTRAAIDMAIYDIIGKIYNCPVYEILGGSYRTEFEMLTNLYEDNAEEKAQSAREYVQKGYRGLKVKVGHSTIRGGLSAENIKKGKNELIAALEAVPSDIYIDADANQSWGNAKIVINIVEDILRKNFYPNLAIEQPLHHLNISGHSYLRNILKVPIILDESVVSPEAMFQIAKNDAADRIVLKINRVGGLWNSRKIINICEAKSIGISFDTMPFTMLGDTALCHVAATVRDPYPVDAEGHLWFETTPFKGGIKIMNGRAILPKGPGLGVELDEKKLATMVIS